MPILATIGAGAGLLARAVGGLFGGEAKARRQARREARRSGRQEARSTRQAERMVQDAAVGGAPLGEPFVGVGTVPVGGPDAPQRARRGQGDLMQTLKDNWIIVAVVAFFLLGGTKLLKPKRRAPRRRAAKPKVVYRYRTKKPATRRR